MPDLKSFERLRWAGRLETHATARHSLNFYNNIGSSATYSNPNWSGSLENLIFQVLAVLIARHSSLSAIVVDEDKRRPYWVRLPQFDLKECVRFVTRKKPLQGEDEAVDIELDQLLEDEHNINFQQRLGELPFWRVVILHEPGVTSRFVASFIHHHAVADGISGVAFHRSLELAICDVTSSHETGPEVDTVIRPVSQNLLPNLEALHPLPLSCMFVIKEWIRDTFRGYFPQPRGLWSAAPITSRMPRSHYRSFSFAADTTSNIVTASRANATTLTGTVQTAVAMALFANLPAEYTMLKCDGAMSLRRWLPSNIIGSNSLGMWSSRYVHDHTRLQKEQDRTMDSCYWDEARHVRKTIDDELDKGLNDNIVGLLRYVWDTHSIFTRRIGRSREQSFEISNVGSFQSAQEGSKRGWRIGRMVFSQSGDVEGAAIMVSVVTGGDGRLTAGFAWLQGIVDEDLVDRVMRDFKTTLEEVADQVGYSKSS